MTWSRTRPPRPRLTARNTPISSRSTYRWESWAAPKGLDGKLDHNKVLTGDDLRDFVNAKLFPYLHGFKQKASGPNTIEYKIGEIFGEIKNKIQSGYNLREIIDHIDGGDFTCCLNRTFDVLPTGRFAIDKACP